MVPGLPGPTGVAGSTLGNPPPTNTLMMRCCSSGIKSQHSQGRHGVRAATGGKGHLGALYAGVGEVLLTSFSQGGAVRALSAGDREREVFGRGGVGLQLWDPTPRRKQI